MRQNLGKIIVVLECIVFIVVGVRLITFKAEITPLINSTLNSVHDIFKATMYSAGPLELEKTRKKVDENLSELLGTWTTTCEIPARPGFQAVTYSITSLNKVPKEEIQADFDGKSEPCPISNIKYSRGSVGTVQSVLNQWDNIEYWLLIPGLLLIFLKLTEAFKSDPRQLPKKKKKRT